MKCHKCDTLIIGDDIYCTECGNKVKKYLLKEKIKLFKGTHLVGLIMVMMVLIISSLILSDNVNVKQFKDKILENIFPETYFTKIKLTEIVDHRGNLEIYFDIDLDQDKIKDGYYIPCVGFGLDDNDQIILGSKGTSDWSTQLTPGFITTTLDNKYANNGASVLMNYFKPGEYYFNVCCSQKAISFETNNDVSDAFFNKCSDKKILSIGYDETYEWAHFTSE
ncbi:hypothetical protein J4437_07325 [Candidatus Woesearchaeota archaeon]|nr:hypothetical protein [uncultured archaeon]MBS3124409.1 hypothetical protein [Candidatus Woesearchaeota archaeon]